MSGSGGCTAAHGLDPRVVVELIRAGKLVAIADGGYPLRYALWGQCPQGSRAPLMTPSSRLAKPSGV